MKRIIEKSVSAQSNSTVQAPRAPAPLNDMAIVSTVGVGDTLVVRASNDSNDEPAVSAIDVMALCMAKSTFGG